MQNHLYNDVLRLIIPTEVPNVASSDDSFVYGNKSWIIIQNSNRALENISNLMTVNKLKLAKEKTEAIFVLKGTRIHKGIIVRIKNKISRDIPRRWYEIYCSDTENHKKALKRAKRLQKYQTSVVLDTCKEKCC